MPTKIAWEHIFIYTKGSKMPLGNMPYVCIASGESYNATQMTIWKISRTRFALSSLGGNFTKLPEHKTFIDNISN